MKCIAKWSYTHWGEKYQNSVTQIAKSRPPGPHGPRAVCDVKVYDARFVSKANRTMRGEVGDGEENPIMCVLMVKGATIWIS